MVGSVWTVVNVDLEARRSLEGKMPYRNRSLMAPRLHRGWIWFAFALIVIGTEAGFFLALLRWLEEAMCPF